MAQRQGWVSLDSIIYDYINEAELSQNKYFKLFHLAFRALENLGMDFFYHIKSVKVLVNANKTVTLPADYVNYTKIGVLNGSGELVPLKYNDKLTTFSDLSSNRLSNVASEDNFANVYSFSSPVFFNYWNGSSYGNLYGIPTGGLYGGGFKIDNQNGVILLDTTFGYTDLVLEYVATPKEGEDYYAPIQFREAIIAWLAWKDIANLPVRRGSVGTTQQRRHEYFEARRLGIAQYRPFYLDQAYMASQAATKLVVKS